MRELAAWFVRVTLIPLMVRELLQRRMVTILVYHRPRRQTLLSHVKILKQHYNLVSLEAFVAACESGGTKSLPRKSLVITFDDGYRTNYELGDVFRKASVRPTIFLCSGIIDTAESFWFDTVSDAESLKRIPDEERLRRLATERSGSIIAGRVALSKEEILELRSLVELQSHTVSHPILTRCSTEKAGREISDSKSQLEQKYGLRVYALAYPNGDYSDREMEIARKAGYKCALTVDFGFNTDKTNLFRLRRLTVNDDEDGPNVVMLKACGVWGAVRSVLRSGTLASNRARPPRYRP
jgi:poly-beta-1,6-N-acetyl-D-glucosamine N-deacetylase